MQHLWSSILLFRVGERIICLLKGYFSERFFFSFSRMKNQFQRGERCCCIYASCWDSHSALDINFCLVFVLMWDLKLITTGLPPQFNSFRLFLSCCVRSGLLLGDQLKEMSPKVRGEWILKVYVNTVKLYNETQ